MKIFRYPHLYRHISFQTHIISSQDCNTVFCFGVVVVVDDDNVVFCFYSSSPVYLQEKKMIMLKFGSNLENKVDHLTPQIK